MTLDELIRQLEAVRAVHGGQIAVYHWNDYDDFPVEEIRIETSEYEGPESYCVTHSTHHAQFRPKRLVFWGNDVAARTICGPEATARFQAETQAG